LALPRHAGWRSFFKASAPPVENRGMAGSRKERRSEARGKGEEGSPRPALQLATEGRPSSHTDRAERAKSGDDEGLFEREEDWDSGPASGPKADRTGGGGLLVEFVRLIIVALLAAGAWELSTYIAPQSSGGHLLAILVGTGLGYVLGGIFGRRTASAVSELEREFRRIPAAEILAGGIGLIVGLVLATLMSLPLFHLPPKAAYPAVAFLYLTMGFFGYRMGRAKNDELFALFGVKPRAAGGGPREVAVLDASAILDLRIVALVKLGFLGGTLLLTRGVLEELQAVADSSNPGRRARGRKALDALMALKKDPSVDLLLVRDEEGWAEHGQTVDSQLVRLARARGGALITNDSGLAKVAAALDVPVRSIHALAEALRPEVVSGDRIPVRLSRRGREAGQAVGYLDDGTMVVVEEADHLLGDTVTATVTNALQTSTGRLIFARVSGDPAEA
jgi:uncharacterized protein YacL